MTGAYVVCFRCGLDKAGSDGAECQRKLASGRKVASVIRSLANARSLQLEYARVLREGLFVPVLNYDSEITVCREKERSELMDLQMDSLRVCGVAESYAK